MDKGSGIIALGRAGDIINVLPLARHLSLNGDRPTVICCREWAPIMDGVGYADCYAWDGDVRAVREVCSGARPNHPRLLVMKVDGNPVPTPKPCRNFILESWCRAACAVPLYAATAREWIDGAYEKAWRELPLVFDRRNEQREWALRVTLGVEDVPPDKPLLCLHLSGHSSPFPQAAAFAGMVHERWGSRYTVLDLSNVRAHRIYDLLGILDRAAVLIAIDSAVLHMAYAVGVPTIALRYEGRSPWYQSEPRAHWAGMLPYGKALTGPGLDKIESMLPARPIDPATGTGGFLAGAYYTPAGLAEQIEPKETTNGQEIHPT